MNEIPERFRAVCEFCRATLDIRAEGVHQRTAGWVKTRKGGGANAVALPERENRWAHRWCVESASRGTYAQGKLL